MIKYELSTVSLWHFSSFSLQNGLIHFVSGREGGVTSGDKGTMNLSFKVGDARENVEENRKRLALAAGVSPQHLLFPDQTHSVNVRRVMDGTESLGDTDALICNTKGLCIAVMSADCVPVLLYDPVKKACAAIHAGWKGTVGMIVSNTIEAMRQHFDTKPSDLIAGIGPSICPEVYEVRMEVILEVEKAFGTKEKLIARENAEGKGFLNLWEANKLQLLKAGVSNCNIEVAGICTYSNSDQFFSARKSKNNTGRFAAGIMLNN